MANLHQVNLGQNTDCSLTIRVDLPRHLETVRVRQIRIRRGGGKDDTRGFRDILEQHIANLLLDILRLVTNGHLGKTGKIDQRQCQDVWRENP